MKKITLTFIPFLLSVLSFAQCKPDQKTKDRITKEELQIWGLEIVKVSLAEKLILDQNTTYPSIEAMIGTFGNNYVLRFNLIVIEKSKAKASYAQIKQGDDNTEILLGFKEGGDPLILKPSDITNEQKMNNDGSVMTLIGLTCTFNKDEIMALKNELVSKSIDGIRCKLAGSTKMEGTVRDKKGEKMKEKFICFYEHISKQ